LAANAGYQSQKNDAIVAAKREELTAYVEAERPALEARQRVLLFVDECFLHWGDVCGYRWGSRKERSCRAVANPKARQTFYGALDAATGEMHVMPYPKAEQDATTDFLTELQQRYPNTYLTICWDNASWHQGDPLRTYLATVNGARPAAEWPLTLFHFAPHDPTQNPIEEVWHQGKTAIRRQRQTATRFTEVVDAFEAGLERRRFTFPNRQRYGILQIK
jgi:transposase